MLPPAGSGTVQRWDLTRLPNSEPRRLRGNHGSVSRGNACLTHSSGLQGDKCLLLKPPGTNKSMSPEDSSHISIRHRIINKDNPPPHPISPTVLMYRPVQAWQIKRVPGFILPSNVLLLLTTLADTQLFTLVQVLDDLWSNYTSGLQEGPSSYVYMHIHTYTYTHTHTNRASNLTVSKSVCTAAK